MGGGSHKNLFTNSISEMEHFPLPTGSLWCFDDWGSGLVVFLMLRLDLGLVLTRWIWDLSRTRLDPHIVLPVGDLLVTRNASIGILEAKNTQSFIPTSLRTWGAFLWSSYASKSSRLSCEQILCIWSNSTPIKKNIAIS